MVVRHQFDRMAGRKCSEAAAGSLLQADLPRQAVI